MAFPIDPGRPPGIQPLEDLVPDQGNVDPRAMLPLAPAREQQHHDVRQHAGLGHVQHDNQDMNLEDMLPLGQAFNLDQDDAMLEEDNNQLREQCESLSLNFHCVHVLFLADFSKYMGFTVLCGAPLGFHPRCWSLDNKSDLKLNIREQG